MKNQAADWIRGARIASWWLTANDFYWPDGGVEAEIKRRAAFFAANGVNTVVIFGFHFRWDYVPYFERIRALLRRITAECHKRGIRVCDHYSDTLIHRPRNEADRQFIRERLNHHVAIYPDADQDYSYAGTFRDSWRMLDTRTNTKVYFEPYRCHIFCPNNPDFQRASTDYARRQFAETGIDGLMNDDLHFLPDYHVCGCQHCRERFRREYGRKLPPAGDKGFWGNRENPAFRDWLAMRLRSTGDHYARLRKAIGPERPLWGCCSETASQQVSDRGMVYDEFIRGCNVTGMEMCGTNPVSHGRSIHAAQSIYRAIAGAGDYFRGAAAHILDVKKPDPFTAIIYAKRPRQFFMCWAMQAAWGIRSWVSKQASASKDIRDVNFKYDDESHLARTLKWQRDHEFLYRPAQNVADAGVVFSPATRNFASAEEARSHRAEYFFWMQLMADNHLLSEAVLAPALRGRAAGRRLAQRYALLVLPQVTAMDEDALKGLAGYLKAGGNLLVSGNLGTRAADGARRPEPLLPRLLEQAGQATGRLVHAPDAPVMGGICRGPASGSQATAQWLKMLNELIPNPAFQMRPKKTGWTFHLYRRGRTFLLHYLNLSGTVLIEGRPAPADATLRFNAPASGLIQCRLRLPRAGNYRAELFSPDRSKAAPAKVSQAGDLVQLTIPVKQARRYGVVMISALNIRNRCEKQESIRR